VKSVVKNSGFSRFPIPAGSYDSPANPPAFLCVSMVEEFRAKALVG
jgi:hypothetical protein